MQTIDAYRSTNVLCWSSQQYAPGLDLYIASWRVPGPIPEKVRVRIYENGESVLRESGPDRDAVLRDPDLRNTGLTVKLRRVGKSAEAVLFHPLGEPADWPIGSLNVPKRALQNKNIRDIALVIDWADGT
jgi:hypothetical protein